jgi:hypothetical protein
MDKEELYEDLDTYQSITEKYLGMSLGRFIFLFVLIVFLGVYIGVLLYGTNSLEVLFGLQEYEHYLHIEVNELKTENAELQRQYFELKEISAQ